MKIFIKTLIGSKTIPMEVQPTDTVENIRIRLFKKEQISPMGMRLIFAGRCLENHQTLAFYNILNESTLHLLLRLGEGICELKPNGQILQNKIVHHLESNVHGPFEAINTIEKLCRRIMFGYSNSPDEQPLVLLFVGVGLCDQLKMAENMASYPYWSQYLVDSGEDLKNVADCKRSFVRIDMNEFSEKTEVTGFYDRLVSVLTECHNAVIVFEEIEQAHPDLLVLMRKLFNQIPMNDCQGSKIVYKDAIFIMTSNLASEEITEYGQRLQPKKNTTGHPVYWGRYNEQFSIDLDFKYNTIWPIVKQCFKRDNFIGRIDEMVCFLPFSKSELGRFIRRELNQLRDYLEKRKFTNEFCSGQIKFCSSGYNLEVLDFFVSKYNPTEGTRSITREIKNRVVDVLLHDISMQSLLPGAKVNLVMSTGENIGVTYEAQYNHNTQYKQ